jgi:hypothetical protein
MVGIFTSNGVLAHCPNPQPGEPEETVLDRIEIRKLKWFGHLMRMPKERWPAKTHTWIPAGRRKRG